MAMQLIVSGDDKDELIAALQAALEMLGAEAPAEEATEEAEEVVEVEEEVEEETEVEEEVDPMAELRGKLVDKIRAMSKKPAEIGKIRDAFKKLGIKKFDDNTPDKKLPNLAKLLGVKA